MINDATFTVILQPLVEFKKFKGPNRWELKFLLIWTRNHGFSDFWCFTEFCFLEPFLTLWWYLSSQNLPWQYLFISEISQQLVPQFWPSFRVRFLVAKFYKTSKIGKRMIPTAISSSFRVQINRTFNSHLFSPLIF